MYKKITVFSVLAVIIGVGYFATLLFTPAQQLNTYFQYSHEETASLSTLSSPLTMESADVYRWDRASFDLMRQGTEVPVTGFDPNATRIYAYLAVAKRDAAFLSFNSKQHFEGSLDPVMRDVICLFFQYQCGQVSANIKTDEYSEKLASLVIVKIKRRMAEDKSMTHEYERKIGPDHWSGPSPMVGLADGSAKTWLIESGSQFRVPPPPLSDSPAFKEQVTLAQKAREGATSAQKQATVFWAGGPGTKTTPGIWLNIADQYMEDKKIPLETVLRVHSVLSITMADVNIAVFDSKYTYWVKRPFMVISGFTTIMPTPNHPSYPAGHSGLSSAAGTVLTHFFPEDKDQWTKRAEEGGLSRVWGGIHFPMDHEASVVLGKKVAKTALGKFPE